MIRVIQKYTQSIPSEVIVDGKDNVFKLSSMNRLEEEVELINTMVNDFMDERLSKHLFIPKTENCFVTRQDLYPPYDKYISEIGPSMRIIEYKHLSGARLNPFFDYLYTDVPDLHELIDRMNPLFEIVNLMNDLQFFHPAINPSTIFSYKEKGLYQKEYLMLGGLENIYNFKVFDQQNDNINNMAYHPSNLAIGPRFSQSISEYSFYENPFLHPLYSRLLTNNQPKNLHRHSKAIVSFLNEILDTAGYNVPERKELVQEKNLLKDYRFDKTRTGSMPSLAMFTKGGKLNQVNIIEVVHNFQLLMTFLVALCRYYKEEPKIFPLITRILSLMMNDVTALEYSVNTLSLATFIGADIMDNIVRNPIEMTMAPKTVLIDQSVKAFNLNRDRARLDAENEYEYKYIVFPPVLESDVVSFEASTFSVPTMVNKIHLIFSTLIRLAYTPNRPSLDPLTEMLISGPFLKHDYICVLDDYMIANTELNSSVERGWKQYIRKHVVDSCYISRFIIIPIRLYNVSNRSGHYTLILIDNGFNTAEYFDPHGYISKNSNFWDTMKNLIESINPKVQEILLPDTCPNIQIDRTFGDKLSIELGYCATWSLLYLLSRIMNPTFHPREVYAALERFDLNMHGGMAANEIYNDKYYTKKDLQFIHIRRGSLWAHTILTKYSSEIRITRALPRIFTLYDNSTRFNSFRKDFQTASEESKPSRKRSKSLRKSIYKQYNQNESRPLYTIRSRSTS
jgi:hypothetical protein